MPDMLHHETTQQLIRDIERKDRRFRFAQSIFMTLLLLGFIAGGWFGARAYQAVQKERDTANQAVITAINEKLVDQSKQLQCVVRFFTIPPDQRQELKIKSVDDCFATEQAANDNPLDVAEGEQGLNFTPAPTSEPQTINPRAPGLQPVPAQPTEPNEPQPQPSEPEPVRILGIPVCVPFTNVCVRQ